MYHVVASARVADGEAIRNFNFKVNKESYYPVYNYLLDMFRRLGLVHVKHTITLTADDEVSAEAVIVPPTPPVNTTDWYRDNTYVMHSSVATGKTDTIHGGWPNA